MKKLWQRVARLTPSITGGLILFTVALTGLLAYRAFDASRAQQQVIQHTLQDYAGFAAFQLKNAVVGTTMGQNRMALDLLVRSLITRGPMPPLGVDRVAEIVETHGQRCHCLDSVSFYYQVTAADSAIAATPSELATPENLRRIRDTVLVQTVRPSRATPPLPSLPGTRQLGVPLTSQFLVTIFTSLNDVPYIFTHAVTVDTLGKPIVAYGFAMKAERPVGRAVKGVLSSQPILPSTLTRGMRVDSVLDVTVLTASRKVISRTSASIDPRFVATDSVDAQFGGLRFDVAINPAAADRLIIGGLPKSRLPEVLATAFVAVCLLGLLLYQFRRQEELGRLRDDFVSGVSHELRTPLAQIRLLAELLRMGKVPTEERKQRSLLIIDQEARRLSFLVNSILSFTHAKPGQLSPVSTDVAREIEEIVAGFEPLAQERGVRITTKLQRGITAEVDRGALRQVLLNLLDNAVRYGPQGQNVTITTSSEGNAWTLEVTDEGPGIPADESERIFAPYYRMERDAGGAVGGTGIGLAVVRRLAQDHGGRVHVGSANGDGSTGAKFVVTLPIAMERVS